MVGQNNARGSFLLIVCEGSFSHWGVDQPSVSDDFGLCYLNLRMWCRFGGAASVGSNGFQATDALGIIAYKRFTRAEEVNVLNERTHL